MESTISDVLAAAFEHHRRGQLAEAEAGYRQVLEATPDEPEALHRLGIIAYQSGRNEVALQLIDRARAINPAHPAYHHDAAIVLHALGRIDDAIARYRTALKLAPRYPKAHNGLGIALSDRKRFDEAAANFRAAVSLKPDYIEAWNNLGNVLRQLDHPAEATSAYRKALELGSSSPSLWYNIGGALYQLGAFAYAAEGFRKAIALKPDFAGARVKLGDALLSLERSDEALATYASALAIEETAEAIDGFVRGLAGGKLDAPDAQMRDMVRRALSTPWARPADLSSACLRMLAHDRALRACLDRASHAWPARLSCRDLFGEERHAVFGNRLLRTLLESAPACDPHFERFLALARAALLDEIDANGALVGDDALEFACALARQCFIDDYVFAFDDDEIARAEGLRGRISQLRRGEMPSPFDVAIVAAYFPLHALEDAEALVTHAWPKPVEALLTQQVREPREERRIREAMLRLTEIDDRVSGLVRSQYEEHPYPKWVRLRPSSLAASLGSRISAGALGAVAGEAAGTRSSPIGEASGGLRVLVAGCGTGQESIELAQALPDATVLAVDLSLASLAYATRKARELDVANIEHAQADILRIGSLRQTFDFISCVGVLHHLGEPMRGLRELVRVLAPNGAMLLGLYSERARADVIAAKAFIAERGYAPTDADIRRCRQDMMSCDEGQRFAALARRRDFYTTNECRDLLFHACEHRFTLRDVRRLLDEAGLSFAGFVLSAPHASRYLRHFPSDPRMADLDNFERFEAQFADLFAAMYIFRVQKRA